MQISLKLNIYYVFSHFLRLMGKYLVIGKVYFTQMPSYLSRTLEYVSKEVANKCQK